MSFHPSLTTPLSKAKKMMLWFAMISITMMFAGLTSAYVVSKSRPDWLDNFALPGAFHFSTLVILISAITFWMAFKKLKAGNSNAVTRYTIFTLLLAVIFGSYFVYKTNERNKIYASQEVYEEFLEEINSFEEKMKFNIVSTCSSFFLFYLQPFEPQV